MREVRLRPDLAALLSDAVGAITAMRVTLSWKDRLSLSPPILLSFRARSADFDWLPRDGESPPETSLLAVGKDDRLVEVVLPITAAVDVDVAELVGVVGVQLDRSMEDGLLREYSLSYKLSQLPDLRMFFSPPTSFCWKGCTTSLYSLGSHALVVLALLT